MRKRIVKFAKNSFWGTLRGYHRVLARFSRKKLDVNRLEIKDFSVKFQDDTIEIPAPNLRKLNPTYALIRPLEFHPKININRMQHFKSMLRWRELQINYTVVFRNYPLGFSAKLKSFDKPSLALKLPPRVLSLEKKDISLNKRLKINEEIVRVLPYVRKADRKRLLRVPLVKSPLHKYIFSREEIKTMREILARQNNTSRVNIKIFEIYDKFYATLYSNVRQASGSKNLECTLSHRREKQKLEKNYYLVVGQRTDTGGQVRAIVDSADIKKGKTG